MQRQHRGELVRRGGVGQGGVATWSPTVMVIRTLPACLGRDRGSRGGRGRRRHRRVGGQAAGHLHDGADDRGTHGEHGERGRTPRRPRCEIGSRGLFMTPRERAGRPGRKSLLMGVLTGHPTPRRRSPYRRGVDNRAEVREFLTSRRAKITPEQAGLPDDGRRRVPGLRRSEVAALAGMSVEYYAKLERGALAGVSAGVLDAIARALQLDDAERAHLFHLAQEADGTSASCGRDAAGAEAVVGPAQPAMGPRRHHRRAGDRRQQPDGPARRQPPRPGPVLATSTPTRPAHRTSPGTRSSTAPPTGSTPTGTSPPT